MYNLVSCYDSLEMKVRGDVLSDKVYLSDTDMNMDMLGVKLSQSESILTDMTHVLSPMYDACSSMEGKSPIQSMGKFRQIRMQFFIFLILGSPGGGGVMKCNGTNGYKHVSWLTFYLFMPPALIYKGIILHHWL